MTTSNSIACRDVIADILAQRLEWITRLHLNQLLQSLGYSDKQIARALCKGAKSAWLRRTFLNLAPFENTPWHSSAMCERTHTHVTKFLERERFRTRVSTTTRELISSGDSIAALFGFVTSPQPEHPVLEAKLRLSCALTEYVRRGMQPGDWKPMRGDSFFGHRGAAALLTNSSTGEKLFVFAPTITNRTKLIRLAENIGNLRVAYEAW